MIPHDDDPPMSSEHALSDAEVERIAQRTADVLFHKVMRRLAKFAAIAETVPPSASVCGSSAPRVKPRPSVVAAVDARRARKGVY
jgi:hypothetical protein